MQPRQVLTGASSAQRGSSMLVVKVLV